MAGDVVLAGAVQRVGEGMAVHRLQCVPVTAAGMTVIDEETRAAVRGQPLGQGRGNPFACWRDFQHCAGLGLHQAHRPDGIGNLRARFAQHELEASAVGRRYAAFAPVAAVEDILADRHRIEQLVGDDDHRSTLQILDAAHPADRQVEASQHLSLLVGQPVAGFHKPHIGRPHAVRGDGAQRAQHVGHHRAAAGPAFDQQKGVRTAETGPGRGDPGTEKFAEHLAHLGRGDEIAGPPEWIATRIIAVLAIVEREVPVAVDAEWTLDPDMLGNLAGKRVHGRAAPA